MAFEMQRAHTGQQVDPREHSEWFGRLDVHARDLVRQGWLEEQLRWERVVLTTRRGQSQDLIRGAMLVAGIHGIVLLIHSSMVGEPELSDLAMHMLMAVLAGIVLGAFWRLVDAAQFLCAATACLVLAVPELLLEVSWVLAIGAGVFAWMIGQYLGFVRTVPPGT